MHLRALAFTTLALVAIYVVAARSLLALVPDYREDLEQVLSDTIGQAIFIDSLEGQWVGFDPVVVIRDLTFANPDLASVREVRVRLAVLRSLLARDIRLRSIQIDDVKLVVDHRDNRWLVGGVDLNASQNGKTPTADLLSVLDGTQIVLADTQLSFNDAQGRDSHWRLPDLSVYYQGEALNARGHVLEPDGIQPLMRFAMRGRLTADKRLAGTVFSEFRSGADIAAMLKGYSWGGISLQQVDASGRLWIDFEGTHVSAVQTSLQMSELLWLVEGESMSPVQNLVVEAQWTNADGVAELQFNELAFDWLGLSCGGLAGLLTLPADGSSTHFYLDALNVACASQLLATLNLASDNLRERLSISEPAGNLRHINVRVSQESWFFDAELDGLELKAYESTPAGAGIDGYVFANADGGGVIFDSDRFELAFPTLFLDSWRTRRGQGAVYWSVAGDDIEVYSDGIRLFMPGGAFVYGDFALRLNGAEHEDYLSLQIAFQDIAFERVPAFVPYYAVGRDLHDWLSRSLDSGVATSGIYVGYGAVEGNNPDNSFTSSIAVNTRNGALRFAPDWPSLRNLNARVSIQNGQLSVSADSAMIHQTSLKNIKAYKPEAKNDADSVLDVSADAEVNEAGVNYWLRESPVAEHTLAIAEQITLKSRVAASVRVHVPMAEGKDVAYDVHANFKKGSVDHVASRLSFSDVEGTLRVSSSAGVVADSIRAKLFDQPVNLQIETLQANQASRGVRVADTTLIKMQGAVEIDALSKHLSVSTLPGLSGLLAYQSELRLPAEGQGNPRFTLWSESAGIVRDWPEPLNKSSADAEMLTVQVDIGERFLEIDASLDLNDAGRLGAKILFEDEQFKRGWLALAGDLPPNAEALSAGLRISANVARVNLAEWLDFIEQWPQENTSEEPVLKQVGLNIAHLNAYGQHLSDQGVLLRPEGDTWLIDLAGPDAEGSIQLAGAESRLAFNMKRLGLSSDAQDGSAELAKEARDGATDPRSLPAFDFAVQELLMNGKRMGALSFQAQPYEQGVRFQNLWWRLLGSEASGQLNWQQEEQQSNSILTLDIKGGDIDKLAAHLDWKSPLTSGSFNGTLAWVWPERPDAFALSKLSGSLEANLLDGRLKTADEKTGALRLFGIFNAETIGRRLKLDFSDLYKSGVSYDKLKLKARIDQGNLRIEDKLIIEGPSSKYAIKGSADLGKETLDMQMVVELPVAQNVPLAALLLGAPQIGGAVWLIDKILGEPLSQITTASYTIKGPWKNPTLELRGVINAK